MVSFKTLVLSVLVILLIEENVAEILLVKSAWVPSERATPNSSGPSVNPFIGSDTNYSNPLPTLVKRLTGSPSKPVSLSRSKVTNLLATDNLNRSEDAKELEHSLSPVF